MRLALRASTFALLSPHAVALIEQYGMLESDTQNLDTVVTFSIQPEDWPIVQRAIRETMSTIP